MKIETIMRRMVGAALFFAGVSIMVAMSPEKRKDTLRSKFDFLAESEILDSDDTLDPEDSAFVTLVEIVDENETGSDENDTLTVCYDYDLQDLDSMEDEYYANFFPPFLNSPYITHREDAEKIWSLTSSFYLTNQRENVEEIRQKGYPVGEHYITLINDMVRTWEAIHNVYSEDSVSASGEDYFLAAKYASSRWNEEDFLKCIKKSIELGYAPAYSHYAGHLYNIYDALLDPEKRREIIDLIDRGCKANDPQAFFYKSCLYSDGVIVPFDPKESVKYLKQAAELGDSRALNNMSLYSGAGFGMPKNKKNYYKYCELAAEKGDDRCMLELTLNAMKSGDFEKALNYADSAVAKGSWNIYDLLFYWTLTDFKGGALPISFLEKVYDRMLTQNFVDIETGDYGYILDIALLEDSDWEDIEQLAGLGDIDALKDMYLNRHYGIRQKKDYPGATQILERMVEIDPSYTVELAQHYARGNDYQPELDRAIEVLEKFIAERTLYEQYDNNENLPTDSIDSSKKLPDDVLWTDNQKTLELGKDLDVDTPLDYMTERLEYYKDLKTWLSELDEIKKGVAKGDADSKYKLYKLLEAEAVDMPDMYLYYGNLLIEAAHGGNTNAMKEISNVSLFDNPFNSLSNYWEKRAEGETPLTTLQ